MSLRDNFVSSPQTIGHHSYRGYEMLAEGPEISIRGIKLHLLADGLDLPETATSNIMRWHYSPVTMIRPTLFIRSKFLMWRL